MGSKLPILAALIGTARIASADPAADMKKGLELYKAGKYPEAVPLLTRAYDEMPSPDALFSLAQAERLAGDCKRAAMHYHRVIEEVSDLHIAKLVHQNLVLCERDEPAPEPTPVQKTEPPPPKIETKIVARDVSHTDGLAVVLVTAGGLGLGAAGGLLLAARSSESAAANAINLGESNRLQDRAETQQIAAIGAAVAGAGMLAYGIYRLVSSGPRKAEVAAVPMASGGAFWVSARF